MKALIIILLIPLLLLIPIQFSIYSNPFSKYFIKIKILGIIIYRKQIKKIIHKQLDKSHEEKVQEFKKVKTIYHENPNLVSKIIKRIRVKKIYVVTSFNYFNNLEMYFLIYPLYAFIQNIFLDNFLEVKDSYYRINYRRDGLQVDANIIFSTNIYSIFSSIIDILKSKLTIKKERIIDYGHN